MGGKVLLWRLTSALHSTPTASFWVAFVPILPGEPISSANSRTPFLTSTLLFLTGSWRCRAWGCMQARRWYQCFRHHWRGTRYLLWFRNLRGSSPCSWKVVFATVGELPENQVKGIGKIKKALIAKGCRVCETLDEIAEIINQAY